MRKLPLRALYTLWLIPVISLVTGFGYLIITEMLGLDRYYVKVTIQPAVITRSSLIPPPLARTEEDENFDRMCEDDPNCRLEGEVLP